MAAGLTQAALAERAGLTVFGIQKLERGTTHPYRDTVARLASALQLNHEEAERFNAAVEPLRRRGSPPNAPTAALDERSLGVRSSGLPVALTSFVGRESE